MIIYQEVLQDSENKMTTKNSATHESMRSCFILITSHTVNHPSVCIIFFIYYGHDLKKLSLKSWQDYQEINCAKEIKMMCGSDLEAAAKLIRKTSV